MESNNYTANKKRPYQKPQLIDFGDLRSVTRTTQGGPNFDGGSPPRHKGSTPPPTGGTFDIDSGFYDQGQSMERRGSGGSGRSGR